MGSFCSRADDGTERHSVAMEVSPDTEWGSVLTLLISVAGQVLVSFDITPEVRQGRGDERLIGRAQARSR